MNATSADQRMNANERQIVGLMSLAHGLNHAVELVYGAVLVVVAIEFDVSLAILGAISNASAVGYSLVALPAGQAADRLGSKRMVTWSMAGAGVAAGMAAGAPNETVLAVALIIMGLLGGLYHPAGLSLITRGVRRRARALGLHGAGGALGTALAPLIAGGIAGLWSWRGSFLLFAVLSIVVAVMAYRSSVDETVGASANAGASGPHLRTRTLMVPLALMFVVHACFGFIFRGVTTFLPLHLSTNLDIDVAGFDAVVIGGTFATVALMFGVAGQYLGGELGERFRREIVFLPLAAISVPLLVLMTFTSGWWLLAAASGFVFFNFLAQPTAVALISDYAAASMHGRIYGLSSLAGFGFGSFAGITGGLIADRAGVEWVFTLLAAAAGLIVATGVALNAYLAVNHARERAAA